MEEKDLWPTPDYPIIPVALEYTDALYVDRPRVGHPKTPKVSVVWVYVDGEWREVARYTGHGLDWVNHIAPIVRKLLDQYTPERPPVDLSPAMRNIITVVESELKALPLPQDRCELLQCVYEFFAGQLAHEKSGSQMQLDWERHFEGR